jgi:hypothetical protein
MFCLNHRGVVFTLPYTSIHYILFFYTSESEFVSVSVKSESSSDFLVEEKLVDEQLVDEQLVVVVFFVLVTLLCGSLDVLIKLEEDFLSICIKSYFE